MTAVKRTSHIRGWQRDNKFLAFLHRHARLEKAAFLPPGVPGGLDSAGIVRLEVRVIKGLDNLFLTRRRFILVGWKRGRLSFGSFRSLLLLLLLLLELRLLGRELGSLIGFGLLLLF